MMEGERELPAGYLTVKVGDVVTYVTSLRQEVAALVTCVHPRKQTHQAWPEVSAYADMPNDAPLLNVLYVSLDVNRSDSWGRQTEKDSSVHPDTEAQSYGKSWKPRS